MSDPQQSPQDKNKNLLKKVDSSILDFSSILQKFGLDLITKIGKGTLQINMLTDKIDKLHESVLDIKALMPRLNNIIENQKSLENEIDLIKTLIQRAKITSSSSEEPEIEHVERDESVTAFKSSLNYQFSTLKSKINEIDDIQQIKTELEFIKEDIFEKTGGHKILYEIGQFIKKLNEFESLNPSLKDEIIEKIGFWAHKI